MDSLWTQTTLLPSFPSFEGHRETEIAIIGGGLAGILTADALHQAGADVVLLEADRIGSGQTAGTTAKLTAQHGLKYRQLSKTLGADTAGRYAAAHLTAVTHLRNLVQQRGIDCDFQDCTSFLYEAATSDSLQQEYEICRKLGMDVFLTADTELPFSAKALGLRHQAHFHPLKLLSALAKHLSIFEHSRVLEVTGNTLRTESGTVTAKKIIFTCHYPFMNMPGYYFLRQHQDRSYVLALEHAPSFQNYYLGVDGDQLSFRPYGNLLLLGGSGHRTGENSQGDNYEQLIQSAKRFWPKSTPTVRWSAQDCIPMDGIPYIGQYGKSRPDWLVATGFQKWGMTSSVLASMILCALAQNRPSLPEAEIFSPLRFHPAASAKQLTDDTLHTVRHLSRRLLVPSRIPATALPIGHGGIVMLDGKKVGAYRDETGNLHVVSIKCPHLGCQLEWNPSEKSWDCPCHGSRFDIDGYPLNGPSTSSL